MNVFWNWKTTLPACCRRAGGRSLYSGEATALLVSTLASASAFWSTGIDSHSLQSFPDSLSLRRYIPIAINCEFHRSRNRWGAKAAFSMAPLDSATSRSPPPRSNVSARFLRRKRCPASLTEASTPLLYHMGLNPSPAARCIPKGTLAMCTNCEATRNPRTPRAYALRSQASACPSVDRPWRA